MNGSATWFISIADCTRVDVLLFESILQGKGIDHRSQHPHMIRRNAIHLFGLCGHSAEEISSAYDDGNLHAERVNIGQLRRNLMNA
jgi:hypothetical protein